MKRAIDERSNQSRPRPSVAKSPEPSSVIVSSGSKPKKLRTRVYFLAFLLGFIGPLMVLDSHLCCHWNGQGKLIACKSNCKEIATALEMYASDNGGNYPRSLHRLTTGGYLKTIPTCPATRDVSYTNYRVSRNPDNFSFACVGNNHAQAFSGFPEPYDNYPRYNAQQIGITEMMDHP